MTLVTKQRSGKNSQSQSISEPEDKWLSGCLVQLSWFINEDTEVRRGYSLTKFTGRAWTGTWDCSSFHKGRCSCLSDLLWKNLFIGWALDLMLFKGLCNSYPIVTWYAFTGFSQSVNLGALALAQAPTLYVSSRVQEACLSAICVFALCPVLPRGSVNLNFFPFCSRIYLLDWIDIVLEEGR